MPYFNTEIDIDVDEFLDECTPGDIHDVIQYLREEGHLSSENSIPTQEMNVLDLEWAEVINKLSGNARLSLTTEEEDLIRKIANRL
jgi:hypothetical protein